MTPQIVVILNADGEVRDVSVLAHDHQSRVAGFRVIEALVDELQTFEQRAMSCLERAAVNATQKVTDSTYS